MNKFDEKIIKMAKNENFEMPADAKARIDAALESLPEKVKKSHTLVSPKTLAAVACAAVLALVVLPNVSMGYAAALQNVPVIGHIVRICMVRNYTYTDEYHYLLDVQAPELESDAQGAQDINRNVEELTNRLVDEFYAQLDAGVDHTAINAEHTVVTDTPEWFTLRLDVEKIQASGYVYSEYYHIDKLTGNSVELKDLFEDDAYVKAFAQELVRQMRERMENDEDAVYNSDEPGFIENLEKTMPERNFYFNSDGKLVLVFAEHEIAPGYMGIQEFVIEN